MKLLILMKKKIQIFGFFENKWNNSGMLHEFNINIYGNDSAILEKKLRKYLITQMILL